MKFAMVRNRSPVLRLAAGLIMLTTCLLLVSDLLGLAPNGTRSEIEARRTIAEMLAVQVSGDMAAGRLDDVTRTLNELVERNDAVLSAGLRTGEGELMASAGEHAAEWKLARDDKSTVTDIQVPIYEGGRRWGAIELRFATLTESLLGTGGASFLPVVLFVAIAGFLAYFLFLRRALHELDPSAVVPDRVRTALNILTEGVVVVDRSERIVLANESFARALGEPADALVGRNISGLSWVLAREAPEVLTEPLPWAPVLHGEPSRPGTQLRLRRAAGDEHSFSVRAAAISNADAKVRGAIVTFHDVTELERTNTELKTVILKLERTQQEVTRQNHELQLLATRDPLTGVLNRRSLFDGISQLLFDARQTGESLSCVMVDIDHFKAINDRFGHAVGDKVIMLVAQILSDTVRSTDLVGRYGGEEFCAILRGLDGQQAQHVAERMRAAIHSNSNAKFTSGLQLAASFGVSGIEHGAKNGAELVDQADRALYVAKQSGRNRVIGWSADGTAKSAPVTAVPTAPQTMPAETAAASDQAASAPAACDSAPAPEEGDAIEFAAARRLLIDSAKQAIERARRYGTVVGLIALDIEMVRRVGNLLGLMAGEKLVAAMVARLKSILRGSDVVSYLGQPEPGLNVSLLGAGEFVVLVTDIERAESIVWVIRRILSGLDGPIDVQGEEMFVTPRIGVSAYPADGEDPATLLSHARSAVAEAKADLGRDAFVFFSADMNRRAREQLRLENLLYRAVERGELYVEYQPRVALHSGRIAAMEALLRWRQPELGIVSPDIFIPLAEHTGLIASIGEWVLRTACRQAKAWHEAGHPAVAISVNLSPAQLRLADIAERILAIVAEVGIQPSMLVLEITESVIVHQIERTAELLAGLRSAGLRISIDDFGTGQSSLAYLKRFPADELKIDRTFLDDLPDSAEDAAIYSAIVTLAQRLGLQVVAEGVETDAQLRFLQRLQCNEAQGYLLSRPLPAESARELLDKFTTIRRQIWSSGRAREPAPGAAGAEVISILNELPARTAGLR